MGNNPSALLEQAAIETGESLEDPQIKRFIMKYSSQLLETTSLKTITRAVTQKYQNVFTIERNQIQITVHWGFKPEQGKAVWKELLKTFQTHQWKATPTLIIRFDVIHRYGFEHLRLFTYGFEKIFANLRRFDLIFHQNGVLLDEDLEAVGFQIGRHLRSLKQLNILFYGHHDCSSESRKLFIKQITRQLFNLEQFTLIFYSAPEQTYQQTSDKDVEVLSSYIGRHLKKLKTLSLGFAMNPRLTDGGIQSMSYNIGHHLLHLHKLSLKLTGCVELTGKSFNSIVSQIGNRLVDLQELDLDFTFCRKISDQDIDTSEYESLKSLSNVKRLFISLAGIKGVTGEDTAKLLERFDGLKKMTMNLSCSGITDKGLQLIGTSISQYMTSLTWGLFNITECESITNQGMKDFATALAGHPSLKGLGLSFENSPGVNNECTAIVRDILHYPGSNLFSNLL